MKKLEFNVKFITPLLIGGAESHVDKNGLSGKALRGCWRFWFRAMVGGLMKEKSKENIIFLEDKVFGSSKNEIGAKFRLNMEKIDEHKPVDFNLGFETFDGRKNRMKEAKKYGFPEGSFYSISIIPRKTMFEPEINILFATIWLWGNIGAIGSRSRRGFGSPAIYLKDMKNNPFSFQNLDKTKISLPIKEPPFTDANELKDHLKNGLSSVWTVYKQWINANDINTVKENISELPAPMKASYFILQSLEQITVGNIGYLNGYDAITAVHGRSNCDELGWAKPGDRMASPVFFRFHEVKRNGQIEYLPMFTWCNQDVHDNNCARNYLTGISIGQKKVFTENLVGKSI